jgi:hypothetical protein
MRQSAFHIVVLVLSNELGVLRIMKFSPQFTAASGYCISESKEVMPDARPNIEILQTAKGLRCSWPTSSMVKNDSELLPQLQTIGRLEDGGRRPKRNFRGKRRRNKPEARAR